MAREQGKVAPLQKKIISANAAIGRTKNASTIKSNLLLTLYFINKKNGRFFPEFLLKPCKAYFHKFHFTFSYITLPTEHSPNPQRSAKSIFSLFLYKTILFDLQSQKATSKLCFFIIDLISTTPLSTISVYTFPLDVLFCICLFQMLCNFYCFLDLIFS